MRICGDSAFVETVAAELSDVSVAFASADEATKPNVASDNVSARSFLIFFLPFVQKIKAKHFLLNFQKLEQESLTYF
jgi:hypothetical protein